MFAKYELFIRIICLVVISLLSAYAGHWVTSSHWSEKWQQRDLDDAAALIAANTAERQKELTWQSKIEKVAENAKLEQAKIEADAANLAAINDGLRKSLKLSESKYQSVSATVAELRRTAATAEIVRSNMLGWCLNRVEQLAGIADRSRAAGLSCQKAYEGIRF